MDKLKVLIAEDEDSIQKLYDKGLTDEMFDKRFASNGVEALDIYETWSPDIIILDIYMPVMTGYSVLKKIRKEFVDTSTAIIMCTAVNQNDDIKDCMQLGVHGYVVKPFRFKTIGTKILKCYQSGGKEMRDVSDDIKY
jgi:CheY-like chemotaxis protein